MMQVLLRQCFRIWL